MNESQKQSTETPQLPIILFKKDTFEMQTQTHKLQEEGVLSQRSDATGKPQDKHHTTHHQKKPDGVKATQISNGRDVREHTLKDRDRVKTDSDTVPGSDQTQTAEKVHNIFMNVCEHIS